jgi:predicted O-linked N-acetylglucosamine transferase (SPINDLY family)
METLNNQHSLMLDPCPMRHKVLYKAVWVGKNRVVIAGPARGRTVRFPSKGFCMSKPKQRGTTSSQLQSAIAHHQAGRLQQAEAIYRTLPNNADALHLLGVIAAQTGQSAVAVEYITRAIGRNGSAASYHCNLGSAYQNLHRLDDAIASFQQALALDPDYALAHNNLGNALKDSGRPDEAITSLRRALLVKPDYGEAHSNLGSALIAVGRFDEAIDSYREAIAIAPGLAQAHYNLGNALSTHVDLDAGIDSFRQAIALAPDMAQAHYNLGNALSAQIKLNAAIDSFVLALALKPDMYMAHNNLGLVLKDIGKLDEALICFQNALAIEPDYVVANSNLLFCVNYHPRYSPEQIFAAYQQWGARQAARFAARRPAFLNPRDPQRRLKVGYLSADFRNHSVIHFAAPLLLHHDKSVVEVFCYHNHSEHDACTDRIVAVADHWLPCVAMSDDDLAARIRADGIDVLVDVSGHTLGNRLLVFARKPAPVQVSWMGFGYSTGLTAMDYFIGDALFTPSGADALFAEAVYRLPRAPWAYQPQEAAPEPGPLPARTRGYVTFACLSATTRLHAGLIEAWAAILLRLPGSRLRLDTRMFSDADLCLDVTARFAACGVPASQLQIGYTSPVWQVYEEVDIVLDCFPHNSGTTTFEALWMGLPVVSVLDRPSVGRFGASILAAIGKQHWVAPDHAAYVDLAVALAQDVPALEGMRRSLRETMRQSPFLDHAGFARDMEAAYRDMWQQWIASGAEKIVD